MKIKPSPRLAGSARRVLVSVGLGATLVLGSVGAASAGTWSYNDPTKDVVVATDDEYEDFEPAPERAAGDVQRFAVSHTQTKLIVRLSLRQNLPRADWSILEVIQTPRAMFALYLYRYDGGGGIGLHNFAGNGDGRMRCAGITVTYAPRSVQLSIPTRCLGTPRVVKVGAMIDSGDSNDQYYVDDAFRRGISDDTPRLSPQIPRG